MFPMTMCSSSIFFPFKTTSSVSWHHLCSFHPLFNTAASPPSHHLSATLQIQINPPVWAPFNGTKDTSLHWLWIFTHPVQRHLNMLLLPHHLFLMWGRVVVSNLIQKGIEVRGIGSWWWSVHVMWYVIHMKCSYFLAWFYFYCTISLLWRRRHSL